MMDTDMEGSQGPQSHGQESQGQVMEYILSQLRSMDERLAQQSAETRALHEHMSPEFHDAPQPTLTADHPTLQASPSSEPAPKRAKLPDPSRFKGDRFAYPAFEEQLQGKLQVDGAYLGSQDIQVNYAFGLLEGPALEFMRPWMRAWRNTPFFTVDAFLTQLRGGYEDPELQENARQKLEEIRQGDRPVLDYIAEFDKTFLEAKSSDLPDWVKISMVRKGLNRKMGRLLVTVKEPSDYSSWCAELKGLARKDDSEGHRVSRLPRHDVSRQANTPSAVPPLAPQFPRIETPRAPEVEMTFGATRQRRRAACHGSARRNVTAVLPRGFVAAVEPTTTSSAIVLSYCHDSSIKINEL